MQHWFPRRDVEQKRNTILEYIYIIFRNSSLIVQSNRMVMQLSQKQKSEGDSKPDFFDINPTIAFESLKSVDASQDLEQSSILDNDGIMTEIACESSEEHADVVASMDICDQDARVIVHDSQ